MSSAAACAAATLALVPTIAMAALLGSLFAGAPPGTLGLRNGALAPCPDRPNCVSSRATDARHAVAPLEVRGDAAAAWRRLAAAIAGMPGARVVSDDGAYLHAEFSSATLGFVDDVELALDATAQVIHVRSAARLGRYDFGVNRARIEALRSSLAPDDPR